MLNKKLLFLGAGELTKEMVKVLSDKRKFFKIIAADSIENAPASHDVDEFILTDLLEDKALSKVINRVNPSIVILESELINIQALMDLENESVEFIPSLKTAKTLFNRKALKDYLSSVLNIKTTPYIVAENQKQLQMAVVRLGIPCVAKPLQSTKATGLYVVKTERDIPLAWVTVNKKDAFQNAATLVEKYIDIHQEVIVQVLSQKNGAVLHCPSIAVKQKKGTYFESWQPLELSETLEIEVKSIAERIVKHFGDTGLWSFEFILDEQKAYLAEVVVRPHIASLVTLAGSQNYSSFDLHMKAILGENISQVNLVQQAASAAIITISNNKVPKYKNLEKAEKIAGGNFLIFDKPKTAAFDSMGVAFVVGDLSEDLEDIKSLASKVAGTIKVS